MEEKSVNAVQASNNITSQADRHEAISSTDSVHPVAEGTLASTITIPCLSFDPAKDGCEGDPCSAEASGVNEHCAS